MVVNIGAVLMILTAIWWPRVVRVFFFVLFVWACWFNARTLQSDPEAFLSFANTAIPVYANFITGWFKSHLQAVVILIAIGQGLIAAGMLLKGIWVKLAVWGTIVFLIAISPLGLGSAFPFPLLLACSAVFILIKDDCNYLWMRRINK